MCTILCRVVPCCVVPDVVRQHSMSGNVVSPFERHGPVQVRGRQEYAVFQYVKAVRLQNLAAFCVAGWAGELPSQEWAVEAVRDFVERNAGRVVTHAESAQYIDASILEGAKIEQFRRWFGQEL